MVVGRVSPTLWPALLPGKTRYSLYERLGVPQSRSGRGKNLVPFRDSTPDRPTPIQSKQHVPYKTRNLRIFNSVLTEVLKVTMIGGKEFA